MARLTHKEEAEAKATSPQATRGVLLTGQESHGCDPKPIDLILSKVKCG